MSPATTRRRTEGAHKAAETRRLNYLAEDYESRVKRKKLTARFVASVKRAADGQRAEYRDTEVKNFALRVTPSGAKSYVMDMRWPGSKVPSKRTIGDAAIMPLADARKIAREWLALVEKGIDPKEQVRREAEAEARERAITFASVAEDYIAEDLASKRRGAKAAQEIRREVVSRWGDLPVTSINAGHVIELAKDLKRKSPTGRNILSHVKSIFGWALHEHDKIHGNRYGLKDNPATAVNPRRVFGKKKPRERTLSDDELRALLVACREVGYPDASCVELLLHTACRREEIAQLRWSMVDRDKRRLVISSEQFKSDVPHVVPLSGDAAALVESLPRYAGPYVFTTMLGEKPINGWSNAKKKIDRVMVRELGRKPERWVIHDLRHTVRTRMAELKVPGEVAEMVLGHGKRGMERVYNEYEYQEEMREAYEKWAELLRSIAEPEPLPENVVAIPRRA